MNTVCCPQVIFYITNFVYKHLLVTDSNCLVQTCKQSQNMLCSCYIYYFYSKFAKYASMTTLKSEVKESGTNVSIKSKCFSCKQDTDWHSQPYMPASQIRAGNFLLAFSIPLSGGSPGKVIKLCNRMGLKCFTLKTYYIYQQVCKVQYWS